MMPLRTSLTGSIALLIVFAVAPSVAFGQTSTFDGFMQEWNGRYINFPGGLGGQCMDLMHQYTVEVLGFDGLHAKTAYLAYLNGDSRFDKIANTPTGVPQKGDLVFWNTSVGDGAGHVAVFIQGDVNQFTSFDQNWPIGSAAHVQQHNNYNSVVGWLHPKNSQPVQVTNFFQKNSNGQYAITCLTDNLVDAQFQLVNNSSSAINFPQVAMALHRESDDSFVVDVHIEYNVTILPGAPYQFPRSFLDGTNPNLVPGTYRLVAKVYHNGAWTELSLHLPFTIVSRTSRCGGSTTTDPLIVGLGNTSQPVRWFYIMNQNTGAWYIVSPTGEQIMFLDRVDKNTSFGIYWRPVNNSSFQTYPSAGTNFSSVTISADGRSMYFGSAIGSTNDPHVSALANTTQPVRWFYIMNQISGAWYIVSPTGQQVMFLDRVDQNTSFGIYWKPINNSSFQGYASAGQNYTSVTISSDGRTISFGALK